MSDQPFASLNGTDPATALEQRLAAVAGALPYPPTPQIATAVLSQTRVMARPAGARGQPETRRSRSAFPRLAWVALMVVVLAAGLAVPAVRAVVLEYLQLGVVRVQVSPTNTPVPTSRPAVATQGPTRTPRPSPTQVASLLDLQGALTLEEAEARFAHPIRLPTYPADLGQPDHVFLQGSDGAILVLVWLEPEDPSRVRLSLHLLSSRAFAFKQLPAQVQLTTVNGQEAFWLEGPYPLELRSGEVHSVRLIDGHVLVWTDGELTYRLETDLTVEEAVRVAESLEPIGNED